MRKSRMLSVLLLIVAALMTCCTNDDNQLPENPLGEGNLRLLLQDTQTTRAAGSFDGASGTESTLASNLELYIFNDAGILEYKNPTLPVTAGMSAPFKLEEGDKYFYLFSNRSATATGFTDPPLGTTRSDFETQILEISITGDTPADLAVDNRFSIQTLWGGNKETVSGGIPSLPQQIAVKVGRSAAKITLKSVIKGTTSPLQGVISNPLYTLGSVPNKYYLVGQYEGTVMPPSSGVQYVSAVHTEAPGTIATPSTIFINYLWPTVATNLDASYYAIENTSKFDNQNQIYYGNTTYINMEVTYTPDASEIYDATDPDNLSTTGLVGQTFWAADYNGQKLIFDDVPVANPNITNIVEYTDGKMYYHFPVRDRTEQTLEKQCCVIRNHSYLVSVLSIHNLGQPDKDVDPQEPIIDEETDVEVKVEVLNWYKIEQGENL